MHREMNWTVFRGRKVEKPIKLPSKRLLRRRQCADWIWVKSTRRTQQYLFICWVFRYVGQTGSTLQLLAAAKSIDGKRIAAANKVNGQEERRCCLLTPLVVRHCFFPVTLTLTLTSLDGLRPIACVALKREKLKAGVPSRCNTFLRDNQQQEQRTTNRVKTRPQSNQQLLLSFCFWSDGKPADDRSNKAKFYLPSTLGWRRFSLLLVVVTRSPMKYPCTHWM